jgi:glycogen debranching enzyme
MSQNEDSEKLWDIGMKAIQALEVERGILASGKEELYGCVFGRDSLITSLLLLSVYEKTRDAYLLALVRNVLVNLAKLQGREVNRQSGEEPGKIIHEFRPDNHEHLTKNLEHPWYLYPDNVMRNYDTVDATPLFLIAVERYYRLSNDSEILELLQANVSDALSWLLRNSEESPNGFVEYHIHPERTYGGLSVQSWMDSGESLFFEDGDERPAYAIAPVEVQAYAYKALSVWAALSPQQAEKLLEAAEKLKIRFAEKFILPNGSLAYAVDGQNRPLTSTRSSIGHCLWAGWQDEGDFNSILPHDTVDAVVKQLMAPDMFVPGAGIRTLSSTSSHFEANSYHNGSIWPHDTTMIAEGLERAGYAREAKEVRLALLHAYEYFQTPLELFVYDDGLGEYHSPSGQGACRLQAWSAAGLLAILSAIS